MKGILTQLVVNGRLGTPVRVQQALKGIRTVQTVNCDDLSRPADSLIINADGGTLTYDSVIKLELFL